ncbi:hypothetical protein FLACOL_02622 [Flavobacterium columnare]|uniref:TonB-dependent receptor n=2 Tax=Flavobacterium TaxID=237 RepID=A0ABW8PQ65_9FLAO|nr:TonB-dependent receptor [Flavobacterium columnare]SPE78606.1 hypothetical protein FLACOL_02622 [Flavobacterium columnare]
MKELKINLLFVFVLMPFVIQAQFSITGKVVGENNLPIPTVEVSLLTTTNTIVVSQLTDEQGNFKLTANQGNYVLQVKQLATILIEKNINVTQTLNLGTLQPEDAKKLEEVTIVAKKKLIERKVDRLVFNVENSISATGGDALDALKVTPGIRVQNDAISMIGKSGMAVMVDDKIIQLSGDDLTNYLKSIASDNIKNIEVITTPPAKYSAEGNSGLINIKLKKAKKDSWNVSLRTTLIQATYLYGSSGANFSYQKGKFGLLIDMGLNKKKDVYTNHQTFLYPNNNYLDSELYNLNHRKTFAPSITLNYQFNNNLSMGIQYSGRASDQMVDENYNTTAYANNKSILEKKWITNGESFRTYSDLDFNYNTQYKIDSTGNKKINFDIDYLHYNNTRSNPFYSNNLDYKLTTNEKLYTYNSNDGLVKSISLRLDVEVPLHFIEFNFGGKYSKTNTYNYIQGDFYQFINSYYTPYLNQKNTFDYQEINSALYFSAAKKLGTKWETKIGLRYEKTSIIGFASEINQTNSNQYGKFFPSAFISYKWNENHNFVVDFSRRISRPAFWELNPAKWYQNLNSVVYGNPFLQPEFFYNYSLKHQYKDNVTSEISFSKGENEYGQITTHNGDLIETKRLNYYQSSTINLTESLNFNFGEKWSSTNTLSFWYSERTTTTEFLQPKYTGLGAFVETDNTYTIDNKKKWIAQFDFWYSFPNKTGEYLITSCSRLDLSIKHLMFNKKLTGTLSFQNIFKSDNAKLKNTVQGVDQSFWQYYDTQLIKLSLSYKIGGKTTIEKHKGGNDDEKGRSN